MRRTALITFFTLWSSTALSAPKDDAPREAPTDQSVTVKAFTPAQFEIIKGMIKTYLKENPQEVGEAMKIFVEMQQAEEAKKAQEAIVNNRKLLQNEPTSPVLGNPKGDVTLVEFFDYNCGYCRKFHDVLDKIIKKDTDLKVVLKPFPILGKESVVVAQLAMAAVEQGKFEVFHKALMESKEKLDEPKALDIAKTVGLDVDKLKAAMNGSAMQALQKNATLGDALRLQAVPAIIIGDKKLDDTPSADKVEFMISETRHQQAPAEESKPEAAPVEPKKEEPKVEPKTEAKPVEEKKPAAN